MKTITWRNLIREGFSISLFIAGSCLLVGLLAGSGGYLLFRGHQQFTSLSAVDGELLLYSVAGGILVVASAFVLVAATFALVHRVLARSVEFGVTAATIHPADESESVEETDAEASDETADEEATAETTDEDAADGTPTDEVAVRADATPPSGDESQQAFEDAPSSGAGEPAVADSDGPEETPETVPQGGQTASGSEAQSQTPDSSAEAIPESATDDPSADETTARTEPPEADEGAEVGDFEITDVAAPDYTASSVPEREFGPESEGIQESTSTDVRESESETDENEEFTGTFEFDETDDAFTDPIAGPSDGESDSNT